MIIRLRCTLRIHFFFQVSYGNKPYVYDFNLTLYLSYYLIHTLPLHPTHMSRSLLENIPTSMYFISLCFIFPHFFSSSAPNAQFSRLSQKKGYCIHVFFIFLFCAYSFWVCSAASNVNGCISFGAVADPNRALSPRTGLFST